MGEVYRARDPRLKREVAIKVLPASFSQDADRLRRFEQEAEAAGGLNHPNITAVYDIGSADGAPYIVTELLEGETLRSRLGAGALSPRKAMDYAIQMAKGLAAAHEKGIVHRDLKPENLFLTKDGRVKILDFGLAKLKAERSGSEKTDMQTVSGGTEPGVVLGTMGYMSPEQVRGKPADKRSDLFAFGTIFYEMLSGQRAFRGETAADTITAILTKEPPDLSQTNKEIHPGVDRIVRHCLEKSPEERFESARDLAFDLEALTGVSAPRPVLEASARPIRGRRVPLLIGVAIALAGMAATYWAGKRAGYVPPPSFHQLTFRRGSIGSARFAPDGQTILYSASWDGRPMEVFVSRLDSPESRPFGLALAEMLSVSASGEMAVSLNRHGSIPFTRTGTLARLGMTGGGAPKEILEDVQFAEWAPDGQSLAVVRQQGGKVRLEFPVGRSLYETAGWISHPRALPARRRGRLHRSSRPGRRWGNGGHRRPRRQAAHDLRALRERSGPLLVAGWIGGLVHRRVRRLRAGASRGDPLRPCSGPGSGDRRSHARGHLEGGQGPRHAGKGPAGNLGARARRAEGAGLFSARLVADP